MNDATIKNKQFYNIFWTWAPLGPLFVQKHQFLQCFCSTVVSLFQNIYFLQCFRVPHRPRPKRNITSFKNSSFYNELWAMFQKHQFLQHIMCLFQQVLCCLAGLDWLGCSSSHNTSVMGILNSYPWTTKPQGRKHSFPHPSVTDRCRCCCCCCTATRTHKRHAFMIPLASSPLRAGWLHDVRLWSVPRIYPMLT